MRCKGAKRAHFPLDPQRGIRLACTLDYVTYPLVLSNWLDFSRTGPSLAEFYDMIA